MWPHVCITCGYVCYGYWLVPLEHHRQASLTILLILLTSRRNIQFTSTWMRLGMDLLFFSKTSGRKLAGIERADTANIDATNKLFVPLESGVLPLSDPMQCHFVAKTASFIICEASMVAGRFALEKTASYIIHKAYAFAGRFMLERFRPGDVTCMRVNVKCFGSEEFELTVNRTARIRGHIAGTMEATHLFEKLYLSRC